MGHTREKVPALCPQHTSRLICLKSPPHALCGDIELMEGVTNIAPTSEGLLEIRPAITANQSSPTLSGHKRGRDTHWFQRNSTLMGKDKGSDQVLVPNFVESRGLQKLFPRLLLPTK